MNSKVRMVGLVSLLLWAPGCLLTVSGEELKADFAPGRSSKDAKSAKKAVQASASKEDAEPTLEDKTHALEMAVMELEVAQLGLQSSEQNAVSAIEAAEHALEQAHAALAKNEADAGVKFEQARLDLDRAKYRHEEQIAELSELEAMYAAEEFAERTKELVLQRGRRQVEVAERSLAITQARLENLKGLELPLERKKAELAIRRAEVELEKARLSMEKSQLESEIKARKAEHAVGKAEREVEREVEKAQAGKE